jgi:hypothetical protein
LAQAEKLCHEMIDIRIMAQHDMVLDDHSDQDKVWCGVGWGGVGWGGEL